MGSRAERVRRLPCAIVHEMNELRCCDRALSLRAARTLCTAETLTSTGNPPRQHQTRRRPPIHPYRKNVTLLIQITAAERATRRKCFEVHADPLQRGSHRVDRLKRRHNARHSLLIENASSLLGS